MATIALASVNRNFHVDLTAIPASTALGAVRPLARRDIVGGFDDRELRFPGLPTGKDPLLVCLQHTVDTDLVCPYQTVEESTVEPADRIYKPTFADRCHNATLWQSAQSQSSLSASPTTLGQ